MGEAKHTWFIDTDEPDNGFLDINDIVDSYNPGDLVEIQECAVIRDFYAAWMWTPGSDEREVREFATAAEADDWVAERRAAIAAAENK